VEEVISDVGGFRIGRLYPDMNSAVTEIQEKETLYASADDAVRQHERFIRNMARKFKLMNPRMDFEDFVQEGRIALAKAFEAWDPSIVPVLWPWASRRVDWAMTNWVRDETLLQLEEYKDKATREREKAAPEPSFTAAPQPVSAAKVAEEAGICADPDTPRSLTERREMLKILKEEVSALSDPEERQLWKMRFEDNLSWTEIGRVLNVSSNGIQQRIERLAKRLRDRVEARL